MLPHRRRIGVDRSDNGSSLRRFKSRIARPEKTLRRYDRITVHQNRVFTVGRISLADTPVDCRRGVVLIDAGEEPRLWQVVVYDPRPEAFDEILGLELPLSCHTADGTLLTGWVRVGRSDPEVGVQFLQGMGRLRARTPWHVLAGRARSRHPFGHRGPEPAWAPDADRSGGPGDESLLPESSPASGLLGRFSTRQRLLGLVVVTLSGWGLMHLVMDIGRAVEEPPARAVASPADVREAVAQPAGLTPVLSGRVAIVERLKSGTRWIDLDDAMSWRVPRFDGLTELHALLSDARRLPPGTRHTLRTAPSGGLCDVVLRELDGERTRCRALLRSTPAGEGRLYVSGVIVSPP